MNVSVITEFITALANRGVQCLSGTIDKDIRDALLSIYQ